MKLDPCAFIVALSLVLPTEAFAQAKYARSAVGDGVDGLPGLYRVPVIAEPAPRVGAGLWLNYGFTEAQQNESGAHHRLGSTLAVGGALFPYVGLGLKLDVRHDIHPEDATGEKDSGTVIDWSPILRLALPLGAFRLGLEARPYFYGATAGDKMVGPTPEGRFVVSYVDHGWAATAFGGYRTPFNGHDSMDGELLRRGDRVALGVSEFAAVTTGLGVMKSFEPITLLGEVTWDVLIGDGAPSALDSPLRLALGVRRELTPGLNVQGLIEGAPGGRAGSLGTDLLVPIEPRVSAIFGFTVRWPDINPKREPAKVEPKKEEPEVAPVEPVPESEVAPGSPPLPPKTSLRIEVVDESGHPISDAKIVVELPATETEAAHNVELPLQELNVYFKDGLPEGKVRLSVEAELLQSYEQQIELEADEHNVVHVKLRKSQGLDGQLRGLVRSYSGVGIVAQIRVEPSGKVVSCNEQGEFALELPPGNYTVMIQAEGYAEQKRPVRIRKDGVTVLNADLHQTR